MHTLDITRERFAIAATLLMAAGAGAALAQANPRNLLLVGALAVLAFSVVSFDAPVVALAGLALILGVASEDLVDDRLFDLTELVYGKLLGLVNLPLLLVGLLAAVLALTFHSRGRFWPGVPATFALGLLGVVVATFAWRGELSAATLVLRPLVVLVLAIFVGYWLAVRYGTRIPLLALVLAAMLAIPIGLYNAATGDLSYYDSSIVYLLGLTFVLVLFRAVDIGLARVPFLVLSALVIVLSLRRGAMLGIAITLLITGLIAGRGTFRAALALATGSVIAAELFAPGVVLMQVESLITYFTGGSGQDFAVNYRHYETSNAWLNVKENWLWGIGATADWSLYRTFDGEFRPITQDYLHNSYLWVWLRYGVVGLIAFGSFLALTALVLLRSATLVGTVVGASMVGMAATLVTASFLTTTTRWPLTVGIAVGIALAASRQAADTPIAAPLPEQPSRELSPALEPV